MILVLKNFYIEAKLQLLLLKLITFMIFTTCLSLFNPINVTVSFSSVVSGSTLTNTTVKQELCGDSQDNDQNGLIDEGCTVNSSSVGIPATNFNTSKTLRLAVVGDIDHNQGWTTQLEIANQYNVQVLIIPGDLDYSNGKGVLSNLESHGFTKENTDIVVGNHDSANTVKSWLDDNGTYGEVKFDYSGDKLALFNIDANIKFDCSSTQFENLESQIESSNAIYKFAVIHQPFVTVKSDHPPNGEFDCYDPMFREGGIDGVLQAHIHNYQRFNINGLLYGVYGTGTHDTGSSMYPLDSTNWEGDDCLQCITGKNGITIIDLQINHNNSKHFVGWFLGMNREVLDDFESNVP